MQLPARKGPRQIAREVDDEHPLERLLHGVGHRAYSDLTLTDRSIARDRPLGDRQSGAEEKRRQILDAAVRVFARHGFHTSRVGDIAEEAGVAHGLLYHYFSSKDEVLQTVFRENWRELVARFESVEASDGPADEKLRGIVKILLRTWRNDPDLVTVMVREVGRSPQLASQVDDIGKAFAVIQRVIEQGQEEGVFRRRARRAARELGRVRRARGDPHGLGDGQASRRRRGGRPCRANDRRRRLRRTRHRRRPRLTPRRRRRARSSSSRRGRSASPGR